mgnify:CR=1 FL=1|tara:strand:+ start:2604 stop:3752 length:1149 start_codon:yes stop_codon:yes gene_type:complete
MKLKLLINIVDRANYGRLLPLIKKGFNDKRFECLTCFTGTTLLEEYGLLVEEVILDGIIPDYKIFTEYGHRSHSSMIKTISKTIEKMYELYEKINPNAVIVIGDRYEALGCAIAASYSNKFLIHLQGGERSSSIDETTRHVITKMAHLHFPSTNKAAEIISKLGEKKENIITSGCPVGDFILSSESNLRSIFPLKSDANKAIKYQDLEKGFILICLHPITSGIEHSDKIVESIIKVINEINLPIVWLKPNADPGANKILHKLNNVKNIHLITNVLPNKFQVLLKNCSVALGNSSSFVRDSSFSGTPVILLGKRQKNREVSENVLTIENPNQENIRYAIKTQLKKIRYNPSKIYGDGNASSLILDSTYEFLKKNNSTQKYLAY